MGCILRKGDGWKRAAAVVSFFNLFGKVLLMIAVRLATRRGGYCARGDDPRSTRTCTCTSYM